MGSGRGAAGHRDDAETNHGWYRKDAKLTQRCPLDGSLQIIGDDMVGGQIPHRSTGRTFESDLPQWTCRSPTGRATIEASRQQVLRGTRGVSRTGGSKRRQPGDPHARRTIGVLGSSPPDPDVRLEVPFHGNANLGGLTPQDH